MAKASKRVIVVGGGLAGLACAIKLAEEDATVDLFSMVPVKRSHSVCAQGGINACNEIARQQGYSEWQHFDENRPRWRLPGGPAARAGDVQLGPADHRPAGPDGCAVQPHA
jgi:hypothetical protein